MIPKFRAWDKDNKIFTNYKINDDIVYFYEKHLGTWKRDDKRKRFELMQSTGLKDKNGKEIFEGDIIDVGNGFINKVDYSLTYGCWRLKSVNGRCLYSYFSNYYSKDEWVIIGNIYENKELLED